VLINGNPFSLLSSEIAKTHACIMMSWCEYLSKLNWNWPPIELCLLEKRLLWRQFKNLFRS
jgi:hypothetical protein